MAMRQTFPVSMTGERKEEIERTKNERNKGQKDEEEEEEY
jgi:hypothetical protein